MNFWFVVARTAQRPGIEVPLTAGSILLLFTSRDKAEEYLQDINIEMWTFAREAGGIAINFIQGNLPSIRQYISWCWGAVVRQYIVDPNPRINYEELKHQAQCL